MLPRDRWPTHSLGTLAEFRNGVNYNKANFGTGIKVIGVSDFQDHVRASFDRLEEINPEGVVRKEHLLRDGDILFVRSNGNRDLIGRSLFVHGLQEDVTHSAFSIRLRFVSPQCCPRFYAYLFRSTLIRQALSMFGGGTNISNLNQGILEQLAVPLPPKPTQERIASILSGYDDLIENNLRRIKILEEMAQMLYREWFVNFRFPGHERVRILGSELGQIPEGWRQSTIGEAVQVLGGGTPSTSVREYWDAGDVVWYSPSDLTAAGTMFMSKSSKRITRLGLGRSSARLFPPRSVMMTSRATIGVVAISEVEACTNQGFITCVPNDGLGAMQIYFWLLESKPKIVSLATGATFKEINKATFRQLPIVIAPGEISTAFDDMATPITELVAGLVRKNCILRTTRDFLLPKLISGEVPVEAAEDAAAELIELPA